MCYLMVCFKSCILILRTMMNFAPFQIMMLSIIKVISSRWMWISRDKSFLLQVKIIESKFGLTLKLNFIKFVLMRDLSMQSSPMIIKFLSVIVKSYFTLEIFHFRSPKNKLILLMKILFKVTIKVSSISNKFYPKNQ